MEKGKHTGQVLVVSTISKEILKNQNNKFSTEVMNQSKNVAH